MKKPIKPTRGGSRKGAGRPKGEPTRVYSKRVKVKHYEPVKKLVEEFLKDK